MPNFALTIESQHLAPIAQRYMTPIKFMTLSLVAPLRSFIPGQQRIITTEFSRRLMLLTNVFLKAMIKIISSGLSYRI